MKKREYKKIIFVRFIMSYTILSVILIGLMGGYWYTQANRIMEDEIGRDNQNRLNTAKNYIEQTVLRKYEDNLQNKALSIRFIQNNTNLNLLLNKGWEGNLSRIASFRQDLEFFRIENEGVSNVTVYFPANDYAIDADSFYMHTENSKDAPYILKVNQAHPKKWAARTKADGTQVLTYIIKLPYETPEAPSKGYFFIDVSMDYLQKVATQMLSSPQDKLYVFDGLENMILHTGQEDVSAIRLLRDSIHSGNNGKKIINEENEKVVLSQLDSVHSAYDWTYTMYRPLSSLVLSSERLKKGLWASCGIVVLFGFLMSFIFSKQLYNPLKILMSHIKGLNPAHASHYGMNEYTLIGNAFSTMEKKIVNLESQAKKNDVINLLLGASLNPENKEVMLPGYHYSLAYIRLSESGSEGLKARYEVMERSLHSEFVPLNSKEAAIIYYVLPEQANDEAEIINDLKQLQRIAGEGMGFGAAIGNRATAPEELADSYQTAQLASRYHFLYGTNAIVAYSSILSMNAAPHLFNYDHFSNGLKAGDLSCVNGFIDGFVKTLQESNMQIEAVELAVLQLITHLYQCIIDLKLQHFLPHSNLFDELKKDTLLKTIASIRMLSSQIAEHMKQEGNHAHANVIRTLKIYIEEHLHEDLSLQILSREVSLAPAYISTLFSEGTKDSFTEYVTRLRLEKAATLLCENSSLSVSIIAEQVGYRNAQYFHSKFKARYGVTPVQYRNSQRKESNFHAIQQEPT
ncbi:MAG: AraC family transcriptional regulator [Paenibacillus sp.]|nr:AraC family transcriptional regulator [Paenibacillus sp.]